MNKLWQARVQAFLIQAGSLIVVAITGAFLSEDFKSLVIGNFGDSFVVSSALLFLTGIASHLRNKWMLGKLGADKKETIILI